MKKEREIFIEKVNKKYGTDINVRFSDAFKHLESAESFINETNIDNEEVIENVDMEEKEVNV